MGEITNLCTCYHVSPSSKSTFCSFKCSTVILIFNSLLSPHIITISLINILVILPGFLTEELCWSWICYLIKTLIKILFPWVKKTSTLRNVRLFLLCSRIGMKRDNTENYSSGFFNLPMKYRKRMTFSYCFTLSCYDESMQLLAGFDQRQRWNPKLCSYSCGLLFLKSNTQVYSWKKVAMGKKFIAVQVSTKHEMGNLGLAVHCISETCSSYCIPSVISGHRYAYGKNIGKDKILLVNLEILNTDFPPIFKNINSSLQKAWGALLCGNKS